MNAIDSKAAKAARLTQARLAAGYSQGSDAARAFGWSVSTYLAHENTQNGITPAAAEKYGSAFKVDAAWILFETGKGPASQKHMEHPVPINHDRVSDINLRDMPRDLPMLGCGSAGSDGLFELNGEKIDHIKRPPRLIGVRDAYGLYVMGDSMSPWREHGQIVIVHPHQPVKIGDYVVVQLHPASDGALIPAYIKKLAKRNANELRLKQFNPDKEIIIPLSKVLSIHRIPDWSELMGF